MRRARSASEVDATLLMDAHFQPVRALIRHDDMPTDEGVSDEFRAPAVCQLRRDELDMPLPIRHDAERLRCRCRG